MAKLYHSSTITPATPFVDLVPNTYFALLIFALLAPSFVLSILNIACGRPIHVFELVVARDTLEDHDWFSPIWTCKWFLYTEKTNAVTPYSAPAV